MDRKKTKVLQWARGVRDFLVEHDLKSEFAELPAMRQELDEALEQLTANAAAQEAITKQSRVQTTEIQRLRESLRDSHLKPIVRMSRALKLEINGTEITFVLPNPNVNNERLAAAGDAMVTALGTVGPQFVARGFASNFVEQLSNATKALREAIDHRSAQVARRNGTTAAMERDSTRVIQLVRVIDTLIRPVIQGDAELLTTWDTVAALPRQPKPAEVVVVKSTTSATSAATGTPAAATIETNKQAAA